MTSTLLTFQVTPAQFGAIQAAAKANGVVIEGETGAAAAHGCRVSYHYSPAAQVLSLCLTSAPPFCAGMALHKLHDMIEQVIQPPAQPAETSQPL